MDSDTDVTKSLPLHILFEDNNWMSQFLCIMEGKI